MKIGGDKVCLCVDCGKRFITFVPSWWCDANVADHEIKFKDGYGSMFTTFVFGKTVFLTKEEAEQALKEREQV